MAVVRAEEHNAGYDLTADEIQRRTAAVRTGVCNDKSSCQLRYI